MANTRGIETAPMSPSPAASAPATPDYWIAELGNLLQQLQDASTAGSTATIIDRDRDNELPLVRLGIASGLFTAMQFKHPAGAGHALRVALSCSAWALNLGLKEDQRELVETAALLHDVGVIGIPDQILLKPTSLDPDETAIMAGARRMSVEILRRCCAAPQIIDIVEHVSCWYNRGSQSSGRAGADMPQGARMITIVEAFDAMTTDRLYRPAMSLEAAMVELFENAGTQFDPDLVASFAQFMVADQTSVRKEVAQRWLQTLDPKLSNSQWQLNCVPSTPAKPSLESLFQSRLLENMYDAVVFIDAAFRVQFWNHGAERLTGIAGASMRDRQWRADCLQMADEKGQPVPDNECPVRSAIQSGVQSLRRLTICGRNGRPTAVDSHVIPVSSADGVIQGAVFLMHDASSESSLEQRCQSLYEKSTKDPLTQVANRSEFDRAHAMFVKAHQQQQIPCSMFICDLDRFKQVNDTYGHQAGDDAIKSLASLLKNSCRPGDLVARYGGEEFVVLYADCDNATAARRAEQIRKTLCQLPQPKLDGRPISASFGVTEIQPGDTPETMLRRADRALLTAKSAGRNKVVQLGSGSAGEQDSGAAGVASGTSEFLIEQNLLTPVPVKMAVEKLRGFIADHQGRIVSVDGVNVCVEIDDNRQSWMRRLSDRTVDLVLDLRFEEERYQKDKSAPVKEGNTRTRIRFAVKSRKQRDRRREEMLERARDLLVSFRSYLMAVDAEPVASEGMLQRLTRAITPWRSQ